METKKQVQSSVSVSATEIERSPADTAAATPMRKTVLVASISAGIQFGWALQLSLLTPYVQLLGIPHKWASFIWLCGPISGMLVTPLVGHRSDRCSSRFGRRRPFIASGAALVAASVLLIGFAADIGHAFGDPASAAAPKPRAIAVFVVGFWFLDVANNMLQAPLRALLADLSGGSQRRTSAANSLYSFFMAVGNVLGYSAGAFRRLHEAFPFTRTAACDVYCANLKSCFFVSAALLLSLTATALFFVRETPLPELRSDPEPEPPFAGEVAAAMRGLERPMVVLMAVTCLNWIAWFPFFLFDTDWMGREVYGGAVGERGMYALGVRVGALGLMLNAVVIGVTSLAVGFLARKVGGVKRLWGTVNFVLAICLALTVVVTKMAESSRLFAGDPSGDPLPPSKGIVVGALLLFSVLGIPLAVTYSVPFALASIFSNATGAGQGLSLGVLNLAIVIPQMVVSVAAGPWDDLFGGGNLPAFVVGAIAAAASGVLSLTMLPSPPPEAADKLGTSTGGFH